MKKQAGRVRKHSPGSSHPKPSPFQKRVFQMTNRNNATNPGRRAFLTSAAAVSAAAMIGTTAAVALQPDPVFAAIEAHKAAVAATSAAVGLHSALDEKLPIEKCRSSVTAWGEEIVATDDPRWIDAERGVMRCHHAESDAACALINNPPATMAGVLALLQYAIAADTDGEGWPQLESDDFKRTRSWQYFLIEMLADALAGMVQA